MENRKWKNSPGAGRFLSGKSPRRWLLVLVLAAWDGLLVYMIADCLIEPVYGGIFVAAVSVYLGYQI